MVIAIKGEVAEKPTDKHRVRRIFSCLWKARPANHHIMPAFGNLRIRGKGKIKFLAKNFRIKKFPRVEGKWKKKKPIFHMFFRLSLFLRGCRKNGDQEM